MTTEGFFISVTCTRLNVDLQCLIALSREDISRGGLEIDRLVLEALGEIAANAYDKNDETTPTEEK